MNTLRFNEIDLEANREGRLTDAQRKKLDAEIDLMRRYRLYGFFGFVIAYSACVMVSLYTEYSHPEAFIDPHMKGFTFHPEVQAMIILCLGVGFIPFLWRIHRVIRGYQRGEFRTMDGQVQSITSSAKGHSIVLRHNWVSSKNVFFDNEEAVQYFKIGQRYRLYYCAGFDASSVGLILSVEELPDEKTKR